jgi:hypothetical protein
VQEKFVCLDGLPELADVLSHMTGDSIMTHQLPLAADAVKPDVLAQHQWLNGLTVPDTVTDEAAAKRFLAEVARIYGEWHELEPAPLSWGQHDPIQDFTNQYPGTPMIAIALPEDEL